MKLYIVIQSQYDEHKVLNNKYYKTREEAINAISEVCEFEDGRFDNGCNWCWDDNWNYTIEELEH